MFLLLFDALPASVRFAVVLLFYCIEILEKVSIRIGTEVSLNLSEPPRAAYQSPQLAIIFNYPLKVIQQVIEWGFRSFQVFNRLLCLVLDW